jgi:hypothetical protein
MDNSTEFTDHTTDTMYHVSPTYNREYIEKEGLKARYSYFNMNTEDQHGPGVWVGERPVEEAADPRKGGDIYSMAAKLATRQDSQGWPYVPHDIPVSDFKRVGHVHVNSYGHPEIHWHPQEHCDGDSPLPFWERKNPWDNEHQEEK